MRYALLVWIAACGLAQPVVDIHPVSGQASDRLREAARWFRTAQGLSWRHANTPEERAVLAAVVTTYHEYFQPELPAVTKIATLTENGQDILVARWMLSRNPARPSELVAWDTPEHTCFLFRLPRHSWSSDAQIRSSFERLLLPPSSDGHTPPARGVTVNIARDPYRRQWIGAGGFLIDYFPRQFDSGRYMNWFDLWETPTGSYLAATFRQGVRSIPERFPPLELRVRKWSKQRIVNEFGRSGRYTGRGYVLAREFVHRNLTDDEFLAATERNETVLEAAVDGRQVTRFAAAIRTYLRSCPAGGKGGSAFEVVSRSGEVNFTDVALEVLHRDCRTDGVFRNGAFEYAATHGTTVEDYRALAALPRSYPSDGREQTLSTMRKRLGLDDAGNPKAAK